MTKQVNFGIKEWIELHREEMTEDIRSLVRIPSIASSGDGEYPFGRECARAAKAMVKLGERYGFATEDCGGRCVRIHFGKAGCGQGGKRVEIWNHLDVVPQGEGWVYPPFGGEQAGNFLIGRGVSDNKGPAVAVLYAFRYLKEQGTRLHYHLSQVCGLSEETGMEDAAWYVESCGVPDLALIADCRFPICYGEKGRCHAVFCFVGETEHIRELSAGIVSNSVAECASLVLVGQPEAAKRLKELPKGIRINSEADTLCITAEGIPGHAAAPEKCRNPIGLLGDFAENNGSLELSAEERKFFRFLKISCSDGYGEGLEIEAQDPVFGRMTCAGTLLRREGKRAVLEFDLRFPPEADINSIIRKMNERAAVLGWKLEKSIVTSGFWKDPESEEIQTLLRSYREIYGGIGEPYVMGGNTYARFFPNAVGFGPGIPRSPHTDRRQQEALDRLGLPKGHGGGHACDEVQSIEGLCDAVRVYVTALQNLDTTAGGR